MKYILAAALALGTLAFPQVAQAATNSSSCTNITSESVQVSELYTADGELRSDTTPAEKRSIAQAEALVDDIVTENSQDDTLWLSSCGRPFYQEAPAPTIAEADAPAALQAPATETFKLHSNRGAAKTIYLNFQGNTVATTAGVGGAAWVHSYNQSRATNLTSIVSLPYSTDGDTTTYSANDHVAMQNIWKDVAEDYSIYNVDVTTEMPSADALNKSSATDTVYGFTAVVTGSNELTSWCSGCGGVAFTGIAADKNWEAYQPAFVFASRLVNWYNTAQAVSHEIGHNLGLNHDGLWTDATKTESSNYYAGQGLWGPIMGAPYGQGLTQWDNGSYVRANNQESDLAIIDTALGARPDDHGNNSAAATVLGNGVSASGFIGMDGDADYFRFRGIGNAHVNLATEAYTNLDAKVTVYDDGGTPVALNDPTATYGTYVYTPQNLGNDFDLTLPSGDYFLRVEGAGTTDLAAGPYNGYGSVGSYKLTVTSQAAPTPPLVLADQNITGLHFTPLESSPIVSGGTAPYTYASNDMLPGLNLNAMTGVVIGEFASVGESSFHVTVADALGRTATSVYTITVNALPMLDTPSVGDLMVDVNEEFTKTLSATGGTGVYTWTLDSAPVGVTISGDRVLGVLAIPGTYVIAYTANSMPAYYTSSSTFTVTVKAPVVIPPSGGGGGSGGSTGGPTGEPSTPIPNLPETTFPPVSGNTTVGTKSPVVAKPGVKNTPPTWKTVRIATGHLRKSFRATFTVNSPKAVSWALVGRTPKGLKFKAAAGTHGRSYILTGKPRKKGVYRFTLLVRNADGLIKRNVVIVVKK